MVKTWKTEEQGETECPNCGARYKRSVTRFPVRDHDHFDCNECGKRLDEWNSTQAPSYEQVSGPTKEYTKE